MTRETAKLERLPMLLVATLLVGCVLGGCTTDPAANPSPRCRTADDCAQGHTCHRGFCVTEGPSCTIEGDRASCYDGPDGTVGIGRCAAGERLCVGGASTACFGQIGPQPETCNGEDDDCDGDIDEIDDPSCESDSPGGCGIGTIVCRGPLAFCEPVAVPSLEICNGRDDDCDGDTDEEPAEPCYPEGLAGCTRTVTGAYECMGVCSAGLAACERGAIGACIGAVTPREGPDACTGRSVGADDDCDGRVDEDCECEDGDTSLCYAGPSETVGVGRCRAGRQTCRDGRFGPCEGELTPMPETCRELDMDADCNGVVGDVPTLGEPCVAGDARGACREGTLRCVGDGEAPWCVGPMPMPEVCNGIDDDCDGMVDDGIDLNMNPAHCGTCGHACDADETCSRGICCPGGSISCGDEACIDPLTNREHCGACGARCSGTGLCLSGRCCPMGTTNCSGDCRDLRRDKNNCGGCGVRCPDHHDCVAGICEED